MSPNPSVLPSVLMLPKSPAQQAEPSPPLAVGFNHRDAQAQQGAAQRRVVDLGHQAGKRGRIHETRVGPIERRVRRQVGAKLAHGRVEFVGSHAERFEGAGLLQGWVRRVESLRAGVRKIRWR